MSELKAMTVLNVQQMGCYDNTLVYFKSEADKVIAELKDKANYNECEYKLKSEELADTCRFYEDELRHQKYNRCLAMAMWCWAIKELNRYGDQDYMDFAEKWRKRWLELAEQFKEADDV